MSNKKFYYVDDGEEYNGLDDDDFFGSEEDFEIPVEYHRGTNIVEPQQPIQKSSLFTEKKNSIMENTSEEPSTKKSNEQSEPSIQQLPEYLSEQLEYPSNKLFLQNTKSWKRFLSFCILLNRVVIKLILPLFCLLPNTIATFTIGIIVSILSPLVGICPILFYLLISAISRGKQLSNLRQRASLNISNNNTPILEDELTGLPLPSSPYPKQSNNMIPSSSSRFLYYVTPVLFELICWMLFAFSILFITSHDLFFGKFLWFIQPSAVVEMALIRLIPFFVGVIQFILSYSVPIFDLNQSLELNDRSIVYNSFGMVLNNICLEKFERMDFIESSHQFEQSNAPNNIFQKKGSSGMVNLWTATSSWTEKPTILFENIKEVSIAVSLETVDSRPINFPWLLIRCVEHQFEHSIIIPIRLPSEPHNLFYKLFLQKLIVNIGTSCIIPVNVNSVTFRNARVHDGLDVQETLELLGKCIANHREDLIDNISRIAKLVKSVQYYGFIL